MQEALQKQQLAPEPFNVISEELEEIQRMTRRGRNERRQNCQISVEHNSRENQENNDPRITCTRQSSSDMDFKTVAKNLKIYTDGTASINNRSDGSAFDRITITSEGIQQKKLSELGNKLNQTQDLNGIGLEKKNELCVKTERNYGHARNARAHVNHLKTTLCSNESLEVNSDRSEALQLRKISIEIVDVGVQGKE